MKSIFLLLFGLFVFAPFLPAQTGKARLDAQGKEKIMQVEDTLAALSELVFSDTSAENRFAACRELIPALVRALKVERSFEYSFDRLEHLSIQYPADSSFRIFTWSLYVDKDNYRYYGAIQMNKPELQLFPLIDRSGQMADLTGASLTPDQWYGALYYKLHEVDAPRGKYYLLFGYDSFSFFRRRKLLDVLQFDKAGEPVFGAPVFVKKGAGVPDTIQNRLVLEYSAEASVRLNYDPTLDKVVFDHLVYMDGAHGEGRIGVPDGSYEGYRPEKGKWIYVERIWDEVSDEAPRPFPVLDKRKGDIFGNNNQ